MSWLWLFVHVGLTLKYMDDLQYYGLVFVLDWGNSFKTKKKQREEDALGSSWNQYLHFYSAAHQIRE